MRFDWDLEKERLNRRKHKVAFAEACEVFTDRSMLTLFDHEHSDDEDRWITMGRSDDGKILVVVHTYKKIAGKEFVRIISARTATRREAGQYFERRIEK